MVFFDFVVVVVLFACCVFCLLLTCMENSLCNDTVWVETAPARTNVCFFVPFLTVKASL